MVPDGIPHADFLQRAAAGYNLALTEKRALIGPWARAYGNISLHSAIAKIKAAMSEEVDVHQAVTDLDEIRVWLYKSLSVLDEASVSHFDGNGKPYTDQLNHITHVAHPPTVRM